MTTEDMTAKLRRLGHSNRMTIFTHQDLKFLINVADRLDELEERIAIMTEPMEATEEELSLPTI